MGKSKTTLKTKKEQTRLRIIQAATRLYLERGFEKTTADQIAEASGISRRTFFRYFPTKESVVFPHQEARLRQFKRLLSKYKADNTPFAAAKLACLDFARIYIENTEDLLTQYRIVAKSPLLKVREFEFDLKYEGALARVLAGKGGAKNNVSAKIQAGAFFGAIRAILRHWFENDCKPDLEKLGKKAFEMLEAGMNGGK